MEVRVKGWLHEIARLESVGRAVHLLIHFELIVGDGRQKQGDSPEKEDME